MKNTNKTEVKTGPRIGKGLSARKTAALAAAAVAAGAVGTSISLSGAQAVLGFIVNPMH